MSTTNKASPERRFLLRRLCRFGRDQRGATAIEFAILGIPFFALLFVTIESALIFLAGQGLETATSDAARLIRTGQAQQQKFDKDKFKKSICDQVQLVASCNEKLILDVRTATDFKSVDLTSPVANGELKTGQFGYDAGHGGDIVVVRAFYEWPTVTHFIRDSYPTLANGNFLLAGTAAFRNEPFPW